MTLPSLPIPFRALDLNSVMQNTRIPVSQRVNLAREVLEDSNYPPDNRAIAACAFAYRALLEDNSLKSEAAEWLRRAAEWTRQISSRAIEVRWSVSVDMARVYIALLHGSRFEARAQLKNMRAHMVDLFHHPSSGVNISRALVLSAYEAMFADPADNASAIRDASDAILTAQTSIGRYTERHVHSIYEWRDMAEVAMAAQAIMEKIGASTNKGKQLALPYKIRVHGMFSRALRNIDGGQTSILAY